MLPRRSDPAREAPTTSILAVDDYPFFLIALKRLLGALGKYDVTTADTAAKALECLQQTDYDLVLIDRSLPDRSGLELLKSIHDLKPDLPCVMLSGDASRLYVNQALEAGARAYVAKDDVPGIIEAVRAALSGDVFKAGAPG